MKHYFKLFLDKLLCKHKELKIRNSTNLCREGMAHLETLDPEEYNCCMMVNGEMVYGKLTSTGPGHIMGYGNIATGFKSIKSV
jgi:hypothetical protein